MQVHWVGQTQASVHSLASVPQFPQESPVWMSPGVQSTFSSQVQSVGQVHEEVQVRTS